MFKEYITSPRYIFNLHRENKYRDCSGSFLFESDVTNIYFSMENGLGVVFPEEYADYNFILGIKKIADTSAIDLGSGVTIDFLGDSLIVHTGSDYTIGNFISQDNFLLSFKINETTTQIYQDGILIEEINESLPINQLIFPVSELEVSDIIVTVENIGLIEDLISLRSNYSLKRPYLKDKKYIAVPNDIDAINFLNELNSLEPIMSGLLSPSKITNTNLLYNIDDIGLSLDELSYDTIDPIESRESSLLNLFNLNEFIFVDDNNFYKLKHKTLILFIELGPKKETISKLKRVLDDYIDYQVIIYIHSFIDSNGNIINESHIDNISQYF